MLKLMRPYQAMPLMVEKVRGPEADHVFPYYSKAGIPVVIEDAIEAGADYEFVDPLPGMVVVHVKTLQLMSVDLDGDLIALGMRLPAGYADGRRLGVELEIDA